MRSSWLPRRSSGGAAVLAGFVLVLIQHGGISVDSGNAPQSIAQVSVRVPTVVAHADVAPEADDVTRPVWAQVAETGVVAPAIDDRPAIEVAEAQPAQQLEPAEPAFVAAAVEAHLAERAPVPPPVRVAYSRVPSSEITRLLMERYGPSPAVTLTGVASTYNPFSIVEFEPGGSRTASGEFYDPDSWTAAIQTRLRDHFGGVRFGKKYQPAFALIESGGLQLIVRINDVGPLKPGRIIDLNERAMRYFDPTMRRGLLDDVVVTPLTGTDWTAGPVDGQGRMSVAIHVE